MTGVPVACGVKRPRAAPRSRPRRLPAEVLALRRLRQPGTAKTDLRARRGLPITAERQAYQLCVPKVILHGSDCTGLGTDRLALAMAGVKAHHEFASERDRDTRELYGALHGRAHGPHFWSVDCTQRLTPPYVDLYVAGPPCQPWSGLGRGAGLDDLAGRGIVFYSVLKYVQERRPRACIIENVRGLVELHPKEFTDILRILEGLRYKVTWNILQSLEHGLPQSRPRVYIVAIREDSCAHRFTFPQRLKHCPPIRKFLDPKGDDDQRLRKPLETKTAQRNYSKALATLSTRGITPEGKCVILDLNASSRFLSFAVDRCPCITATRASQFGYLIIDRKRCLSLKEMARLQGFTTRHYRALKAAKVDPKRVAFALGNAMSLNVILRLVGKVAYAAGLVANPIPDPWKHAKKSFYATCPGCLPDDMYS